LLLLAAARGREVEIAAEGLDEQEALEALTDLVARGFEDAATV
jgi:phosphotransferase system HPr-like phosphotransfer protein